MKKLEATITKRDQMIIFGPFVSFSLELVLERERRAPRGVIKKAKVR